MIIQRSEQKSSRGKNLKFILDLRRSGVVSSEAELSILSTERREND